MPGWWPKRSTNRRARDQEPLPHEAEKIERLKQENEQLREQVAEQAKRIAELERELALHQQNSTTSSKPAVQWRKIMFGTRSAAGELAVARLLTVMSTCQMQQLNVLAYLTAAIQCHRRRQEVPSLLPKRP